MTDPNEVDFETVTRQRVERIGTAVESLAQNIGKLDYASVQGIPCAYLIVDRVIDEVRQLLEAFGVEPTWADHEPDRGVSLHPPRDRSCCLQTGTNERSAMPLRPRNFDF